MGHLNRRVIGLVLFSVLALIWGGGLLLEWLIPQVIPLDTLKSEIQAGIAQSTGIRTEIETLDIKPTLFHGVQVTLDNNVLFDPANVKLVQAGTIEVNVRYLPLLLKQQASVSRIAFNRFKGYIYHNSYFFRIKIPKSTTQQVVFDNARFEFNHYDILVENTLRPNTPYFLRGEQLAVNHWNALKPLHITGRGGIFSALESAPHQLSRWQIDAKLRQEVLHKSTYKPQDLLYAQLTLAEISPGTLSPALKRANIPLDVVGRVNALQVVYQNRKRSRQIQLLAQNKIPLVIRWQDHLYRIAPGRIEGEIITPDTLNQPIRRLDKISLKTRHGKTTLTITGKATLAESLPKSMVDLQARVADLRWENVHHLSFLPLDHAPWLRHTEGLLGARVSLQGSLEDPRYSGVITLSQGAIHTPQHVPLAQHLQGQIRFDDRGQLHIEPLQGLAAQSAFNLNGKIDLTQRSVNLHGWAKRLNLARLQTLITQLNPALKTRLTGYHLHGQAGGDVKVQGALAKPALTGTLDLWDAGLSHRNHWVFHRTTGQLQMENQRLRAKSLNIRLGNSTLMAAGWWDPQKQALNAGVQGQKIPLSSLRESARFVCQVTNYSCPLLNNLALSGTASLNLHAQGKQAHPSLHGFLTLANAQAKLPSQHLTLDNVDVSLNFTDHKTEVTHFQGKLNQTAFRLTGQILDYGRRLDLQLQAPNIALERIADFVAAQAPGFAQHLQARGNVSVQLALKGSPQHPKISGALKMDEASLSYAPQNLTASHITGQIKLTPQRATLEPLRLVLNGIPLTLGGWAAQTLKEYQVTVQGSQIPLTTLEKALVQMSPELARMLTPTGIESGTADLNLRLAHDLPVPHLGGTIGLKQLRAMPQSLGMPVYVGQTTYNLETGQLSFPSSGITVGAIPFQIQGSVLGGNQYRLNLKSGDIPLSFIRDNQALVELLTQRTFPTMFNTQGAFRINAHLSPEFKEVVLSFLDAGASMKELTYPFYDLNGVVRLQIGSQLKAFTDNLSLRYGNSPMKLKFDVNGSNDIYLETQGTLSPMVVNDWFLTNDSTKVAYAALPYEITLSGKLGELWGTGQGNNLHMFFNFNVASLLANPNLTIPTDTDTAALAPATLSSVLHLLGDSLKIEETRFWAGPESSLILNGLIQRMFTPDERQVHLSLITDPTFDLAALAQQLKLPNPEDLTGTITSNVKMDSLGPEMAITGEVIFDHIRSSLLELEDVQGKIIFDGLKALLNFAHVELPGVDVGFTAEANDLLQYPVPLDNFHLAGKEFIVPLYTEWLHNVVTGKLKQGIWEQFFPSTGRYTPLPFEIRNGTIALDEGIINNLIVNNYTSTIRLYPNTYFELDDIKAESAGGHVSGHFALNPRDNNFMTVHMVADKMKANAVSRILLNVTNQIFGDLSGVIDYTTEGMTSDALLSNTNGYADLKIENGRLPSIAKMENLLVAANTISGGIANLNLNSLFRIAAPFNTDYFAELTGIFKMVNGIIYTDNMLSNGKNLDLLIQGKIRMVDGISNLRVQGTMDQEIGGLLGPLGDLSFGRFLGIFPPLRILISHIPGLGFIPGFGGPRTDKGVSFEVQVQGPVTDPGSIQNFKWINESTVKK